MEQLFQGIYPKLPRKIINVSRKCFSKINMDRKIKVDQGKFIMKEK